MSFGALWFAPPRSDLGLETDKTRRGVFVTGHQNPAPEISTTRVGSPRLVFVAPGIPNEMPIYVKKMRECMVVKKA